MSKEQSFEEVLDHWLTPVNNQSVSPSAARVWLNNAHQAAITEAEVALLEKLKNNPYAAVDVNGKRILLKDRMIPMSEIEAELTKRKN